MLSGIRERTEWRQISERTKELSYNEVFRKGFVFLCSPSSSLRITKKFEICIFYFLTVHIVLTEADNVPLISLTGLIFYIPSYCQNMRWRSHPHFFFFRKHVHCTCSLAKELHSPSNKSWLSVVPLAQRITGCDEILLYRPFSVRSLLAVTEELKSLELAEVAREMIKKHATKTGIK